MNKNFLIFNKSNGALEESEVKLSVFDLENLYVDTFTNSLYVGEDESTKTKITDVISAPPLIITCVAPRLTTITGFSEPL